MWTSCCLLGTLEAASSCCSSGRQWCAGMQLRVKRQCQTLLLHLRRRASSQCAGLCIHGGLDLQPRAVTDCCHDALPHTGV
jgi:hypothetical protein